RAPSRSGRSSPRSHASTTCRGSVARSRRCTRWLPGIASVSAARHAPTTPVASTGSVPRAAVRDLFLRLLGLVFLVAFLSLLVQLDVLVGRNGLLPVDDYLKPPLTFLRAPTIFWLDHRDGTLRVAAIAGALVSVALVLNVAPRWCIAVLW